ncbi:hypothetical protein EKO27_g9071 [Xylaria grammica]|uniref:Major facilitator superfamily (MFS) profile domain-containing protein n=1 Tax=Xylaria grammica TaxID=363999 RepID=A0A439CV35_9PEZI|nr:hypothetical protein EKO27_g9071 [Xylaria grammica]
MPPSLGSLTYSKPVEDATMRDTAVEGRSDPEANRGGWSGPDDPENPQNRPTRKSFGIVIIVAVLSMIVNIAATIVAPGISSLVREFKIQDEIIPTLTVTIYLLGFATGSLFISAFSEMYGRLVVYHTHNVMSVTFVISCASSHSTSEYLVFRFISGFAGLLAELL